MKKNMHNILLTLVMFGLFCLNFTPVLAQQMLVQILGGGYTLYGPSTITFPPQIASITGETVSERSIRDIAVGSDSLPGYLLISDYNGGREFTVSVSATVLKRSESTEEIALSNFKINNRSSTGDLITTINGRSDGLSLNASSDSFVDFSTTRTLADGTGQAPGEWKIYPTLQITIPSATRTGIYESTLTFTIT